jgi:luciferase family oxidoreductase group 1
VLATIELARLAERLGYHRYWLAEHHSSSTLADASPEVLIPIVAAHTSRIRVGSGGIMLSHYSPLKVAEQFRMMEAVYPGRIDIGLGRAPGSDGRTARALQPGQAMRDVDDYPQQVLDVLNYLRGRLPDGHEFTGVTAMPAGPAVPEMWLLASSMGSTYYAAALGLPLSFAHFISQEGGPEAVEWYRRNYCASDLHPEPRVSIGISVTCADTDAEARGLGTGRHISRLRREQGRPLDRVLTSEEAEAELRALSANELAYVEAQRARAIEGSPETVRRKTESLAAEYGADEVIVLTIMPSYELRAKSYMLVANEFNLAGDP